LQFIIIVVIIIIISVLGVVCVGSELHNGYDRTEQQAGYTKRRSRLASIAITTATDDVGLLSLRDNITAY